MGLNKAWQARQVEDFFFLSLSKKCLFSSRFNTIIRPAWDVSEELPLGSGSNRVLLSLSCLCFKCVIFLPFNFGQMTLPHWHHTTFENALLDETRWGDHHPRRNKESLSFLSGSVTTFLSPESEKYLILLFQHFSDARKKLGGWDGET